MSTDQASPVTHVAIKLPPFWPSDPAIWFAQAEAQFATRGITSEITKFRHIITALAPETAVEVRDILLQPPSENPYTALKEALTVRTAESTQLRVQRLISGEELGDRKPSQLLRRMQQLVGDATLGDTILQQMFLQRLPSNVQLVLAGISNEVTLDKQAELADRMMEAQVPAIAASSSSTSPTSGNFTEQINSLHGAIADLQKQLHAVQIGQQRHSSQRRHQRNRSRSSSRNRSDVYPDTPDLCFYHWRYGRHARNCNKASCSKALNGPAGQ